MISGIFFNEKINFTKIIGLITCLIGVFAIIIKGDLDLLINLKFTIGDLWMLAAAIGWALVFHLFILLENRTRTISKIYFNCFIWIN